MIPLHDYILVRPDEQKQETDSGLWIPKSESTFDQPNTGVIVGAGPGRNGIPNPYHRKQRIKYNLHAVQKVDLYGREVHLIDANDVYCVLNDDIDQVPPG